MLETKEEILMFHVWKRDEFANDKSKEHISKLLHIYTDDDPKFRGEGTRASSFLPLYLNDLTGFVL